MKIALCSDAPHAVDLFIKEALLSQGHEVQLFGSFASQVEVCWAQATLEAARAVSRGTCDEGIFLCWSGTGAAMAANKVAGVRGALCTDAVTAGAARTWNHANVLALSHRLLTQDLAQEILEAWFKTPLDPRGAQAVGVLQEVDASNVAP